MKVNDLLKELSSRDYDKEIVYVDGNGWHFLKLEGVTYGSVVVVEVKENKDDRYLS